MSWGEAREVSGSSVMKALGGLVARDSSLFSVDFMSVFLFSLTPSRKDENDLLSEHSDMKDG